MKRRTISPFPSHRFSPLGSCVSLGFAPVSQAAGRARAYEAAHEPSSRIFSNARHRAKPLLLLLIRAVDVDGAHRQADLHAPRRRERRRSGNLHLTNPAAPWLPPAQRSRALQAANAQCLLPDGKQLEGNASSTQYSVMMERDLGSTETLFTSSLHSASSSSLRSHRLV